MTVTGLFSFCQTKKGMSLQTLPKQPEFSHYLLFHIIFLPLSLFLLNLQNQIHQPNQHSDILINFLKYT